MSDGTTNTQSEEIDERRLSALLAAAEGEAPRELAAAARRQGERRRARHTAVSAVLAFVVVIAAGVIAIRYGGSGGGTSSAAAAAGPAAGAATPTRSSCAPETELGESGQRTPCSAFLTQSIPAGGAQVSPAIGTDFGTVGIRFGSDDDLVQWQLREGAAPGTLDSGTAGHFPGTAMPGQSGNFAIAVMPRAGEEAAEAVVAADKVTVWFAGRTYVYQIDARSVVGLKTTGAVAPVPEGSSYTGPGSYLTIVTQVPDDLPTLRTVVWGHLAEVIPG